MTLDQKRLHEALEYNPLSGAFTWKIGRRGLAKKGSVAGTKKTGGYIQIMLDGQMYLAHRLAWFYVHGVWPNEWIDHKNRNTSDNRIANLREATKKQNRENTNLPKNNTTGVIGVFWVKRTCKWQAKIGHNKRRIHLGYFENKDEAIAAIKKAEVELFTHRSAS